LNVHRYDRFGVRIPYSIAFFEGDATEAALGGFTRAAIYEARCPLVVSPKVPEGHHHVTPTRFFELLGGAVDDSLVQRPTLSADLASLGRGTVPEGLDGRPDELLEHFVWASLQYLIGQRARPWGTDRRFEPLPDGVLPGAGGLVLLYDTKAYKEPYEVSADDLRRYATYVRDFNDRYGHYFGPVYAFIVVSGAFAQNDAQRDGRSQELFTACRTPLCFLASESLGELVARIRGKAHLRSSVDWKRVFAARSVRVETVDEQLRSLEKDALVRNE
jgi:hypothetical protein